MIASNQRSARAALSAARPLVARLDVARDPEEVAADLIEVWPAIETALRSLVGGSALSGQALIHEVRQRELISLQQAHLLVELLAVYDRVQRTDYRPSDADIATAHEAYHVLEEALSGAEPQAPATYAPPPASARVPEAPPTDSAEAESLPATRPHRGPLLLAGAVAFVVVVLAALGSYFYVTRYGVQGDIRAGIRAYATGQPVVAKLAFTKAAQAHPDLVVPHLYLGRLARDEGDFGTAGTELSKAAQLAPNDVDVQRELGAFFLARGRQYEKLGRRDLAIADFDAARNRYVSAIKLDGSDRSAQGYLGCALVALGRVEEGQRWLTRAGPGGWTACAPSTQTANPPPHT